MKKISQLLLIILTVILTVCSNLIAAKALKLINTVGDERDNYVFYKINGAVMNKQKNLYILDIQDHTISMYDWKGTFIKKTGQRGKGPQDFFMASNLTTYGNSLYLFDKGNARMVKMSPDLETFEYFKLPDNTRFYMQCIPLSDDAFIGTLYPRNLVNNRIGVINRKGKKLRDFFKKYPVNIDSIRLDRSKKQLAQIHKLRIAIETIPRFCLDEKKEQVLISFFKPDNPVVFYVYTVRGKQLHRFEYDIEDPGCRFFRFNIEASWDNIGNPKKMPKQYAYPLIQSLFIHKNHYAAVLKLLNYHKKDLLLTQTFLLLFDKEGNQIYKKKLPDDMKVFSISNEGYVLATRMEEEVSKLYIFRLLVN